MLAECQAKDGYLGAYPATSTSGCASTERCGLRFTPTTRSWPACSTCTNTQETSKPSTWRAHGRLGRCYARSISDDEWQKVLLVEHGGMNEASFNLYAITGKTKYRDLGYRFEHKKIFDPLAAGEDKLDGNHANTNIPKVIGAARGYELDRRRALPAHQRKLLPDRYRAPCLLHGRHQQWRNVARRGCDRHPAWPRRGRVLLLLQHDEARPPSCSDSSRMQSSSTITNGSC